MSFNKNELRAGDKEYQDADNLKQGEAQQNYRVVISEELYEEPFCRVEQKIKKKYLAFFIRPFLQEPQDDKYNQQQ